MPGIPSQPLTRRQLLRAGAAACAAPLAWSCGPRRPAITGSIVGQAEGLAHRLRDGPPPGAARRREEVAVAIVGGGIAGLSAAWKLARSGLADFRLLELERECGGTSLGGANAVARFPWGAHYVPVPSREQRTLCELLEELGLIRGFDAAGRALADERHLLRAPSERVFSAGRWSEGLYPRDGASAEDLRQLERFERVVEELAARVDAEGRRWFALPLAYASRAEEALALDRVSMAAWLAAEGFDSPRLRWYVEYACRDDFGTLLPEVSAYAALHYFASRARGAEGAYLTWPEGNAFLARALARSAEGRVRDRALVLALEPDATGVVVRWLDARADEIVETRAEHAVLAVPRFVARRLVRSLAAETAPLAYAPWVVANLTLESRPAEHDFPLAWDNVLHASDSLGYVVATHQEDRAEPGDVWTWYRPFCARDAVAERRAVGATTWEGWRDAVLADLGRPHPDLARHVRALDVWRWGHAMIRPEVGFRAARGADGLPWRLGRITCAGTDLAGLALFEEAQWSGVRAAERVLAERGIAFASSL
jgi:monoamine oxidase